MDAKETFTQRRKTLRADALKAIDTYDGPKAVTLATGEKALDMDDAWLLIGKGCPTLRHKKDQRAIEKGREPSWEDVPLGDNWGTGALCDLADKLQKTNNRKNDPTR